MSDLSTEERIKLAVSFIEQSPPGEVNDVVNAIRTVIGDDDALMPHAVPALRAYNLTQLQVVNHSSNDGDAHSSLISDATIVPNASPERFYDHAASRTFTFDHVTLVPGEYEPVTLPEDDAAFRSLLAESLDKYARNHFPSGQASVSTNQLPVPPPEKQVKEEEEEEEEAEAGMFVQEDADAPEDVIEAVKQEMEEERGMILERDIPGSVEDYPTPEDGPYVPRTQDEVDAEGGIEALDEEIDEVFGAGEAKEDEAKEDVAMKDEAMKDEAKEDKVKDNEAKEDATMKGDVTGDESMKEEAKDDEGMDDEAKDDEAKDDEAKDDEAMEANDEEKEDACDADDASPAAASSPVPAAPAYTPIEDPTFTLEIVGNRFNPSNFWTGRWRTHWVVDRAAKSVAGTIRVDVHYYEQGNVQLATEHRASFVLPEGEGGALASAIVSNIARIETEYQLELGDVYTGFGDKAFRALRRALPVTRQRVDWDKVSGYSIGSDITKAFA
ncbi:hypothetical protein CspeluHIS016_0201540 [Cutaneotrichosporon spelunceum]|uniref:F-actin capping n=1 Tax=Cutaneotrichosporon spelunceum TaxID=1672016 RepID=A0AAD3TQY6_9TREE|nr:hypothetical protein CspeluHIS016_0201540 [Cutaneotrichosporon spelunceum]